MSGVLYYHNLENDAQFRSNWERTRIQTFYLLNIHLDKKNKLTYEKFKRDVWPFFWEKNKAKEVNEEEIMDMSQWQEIFSKPIITQEAANPNDLKI